MASAELLAQEWLQVVDNVRNGSNSDLSAEARELLDALGVGTAGGNKNGLDLCNALPCTDLCRNNAVSGAE